MKMPKYEVWQSNKDDKWYWRLVAPNGETITPSQGYKSKAGAEKGIRSVRLNAPFARIVYVDGNR